MVKKTFVAQHFLTVPDCGPENEWHSHTFTAEVVLEAPELNEHGYLCDIVEVSAALEVLVARYRDRTMNELPEFAGLNPSIEHVARTLCEGLADRIETRALHALSVKVWEDDLAWAMYRKDAMHEPEAR